MVVVFLCGPPTPIRVVDIVRSKLSSICDTLLPYLGALVVDDIASPGMGCCNLPPDDDTLDDVSELSTDFDV